MIWRTCGTVAVSVHITRSLSTANLSSDLSPIERLAVLTEGTDLEEAARRFTLIGVSCVAYACTSGSFARRTGYDAKLIARIRAASGWAATTTSTALVAALKQLSVRKLAVAAPYVDELCERLRIFLQGSGFDVVNMSNLRLQGMAIGAVSTKDVVALAKRATAPNVDALLIACTAFRTLEVLETLEGELGKPVVSANQATMWHALRISGIPTKLDGIGQLYRA
jgi:maleate isomerase